MYRAKLIILGLLLIFVNPAAAWWDTDWENRREIQINNTLGSELTYYQVYVNLTDNPINSTSLRVVNESSGLTVPHWQETITDNNCTALWFNATAIPAGTWFNETYYIYYNNNIVISSNITNTFLFGDDFITNMNWINKWISNSEASYIIIDNTLRMTDTGTTYSNCLNSILSFNNGFIINARVKGLSGGTCEPSLNLEPSQAINSGKDICRVRIGDSFAVAINGAWTTGNTGISNTWYKYNLEIPITDNAKAEILTDDDISIISKTGTPASRTGYIYLQQRPNNYGYIDWIFVRKYTTDPPITIIGNEEKKFIPPIPINLDYTRGFFWVNHTWDTGTGNITDSYNVSHNSIWYNNTINTYYNSGNIGEDGWSNITIYAYNNSGGGTLSEDHISQNIQVAPYAPPDAPINLAYTKGEYWANHTWDKGNVSFIGTYNVSHNGSWTNGSSNTYFNSGQVGRNGISTIIVYAFNGLLSEEYITQTISTKLGIGYEQKTSNQNIQSIYFPLMFILLMFIIVGAFKYMFMDKK